MKRLPLLGLLALLAVAPLTEAGEPPNLGVGLTPTKDGSGVFITSLTTEKPAWRMGFRVDDRVESVKIGSEVTRINRVETAEKALEKLVFSKDAKFVIIVRRYAGKERPETLQLIGTVDREGKDFRVRGANTLPLRP